MKKQTRNIIEIPDLINKSKESLDQVLIDTLNLYGYSTSLSRREIDVDKFGDKLINYMGKYQLNLRDTIKNLHQIQVYNIKTYKEMKYVN